MSPPLTVAPPSSETPPKMATMTSYKMADKMADKMAENESFPAAILELCK
jgi:hypothetical protein